MAKKKVNAYRSSDYAGLSAGKYSFYFGYEEIVCPKHGTNYNACSSDDCDKSEWAFVASVDDKEVFRIREGLLGKEIDEPAQGLVLGIGHFLSELK